MTINPLPQAENISPIFLPSYTDCLALMEAHGMLPNIREHSFRVMRVAAFLGEALSRAGLPLHLPLIEAGALLHDLGKTPCLGTTQNHAEWGAAVLDGLGYPEVAQVVRQHVYLQPVTDLPSMMGEVEVVNYADKRVMHDRIVTLETRFADLLERYGRTPVARSRIAELRDRSRSLEEKLFAVLPLTPDDLLQLNHGRDE